MRAKGYVGRKRRWQAAVVAFAVTAASVVMGPQQVCAMDFFRESDGNYVTEEDENGYYYLATEEQLAAGECEVFLYGGKKADIVLPKTCGAYKVTSINNNFSSMLPYLGNDITSLSTVKIPSGYRVIRSGDAGRSGAFQDQRDLYRIEIPKSVTQIDDHVFDNCDLSKLTIVAPYGSAAEAYAFAHGIYCTNSKSLQLVWGGAAMYAGEQRTIAVYNNGSKIKWKSSNTAVASVDANGMVTAKKPGSVKITATIGKKSYSAGYTVMKRTENNVLSVIWESYVTPEMSDYERAVAAARWMAAVDREGSRDTAKAALENGTASYTGWAKAYQRILQHYGMTVKVTADGKRTTNKVKIGSKTYTLDALLSSDNIDTSITTTNAGGVVLKRNRMTLKVGKTGTYGASGTSKKIVWSSSNKKVATVSAGGKVTAKAAGSATITMKVDGKTYACAVQVTK